MNSILVRIWIWILILAVYLSFDKLTNTFVLGIQIQIINNVEWSDFVTFILRQVLSIYSQCIFRAHGECRATLSRIFFVLRILRNWDHADWLLGALWVRYELLLIVMVFLASDSCVLLKICVEIYCFHVHVEGWADGAIGSSCRIIIYRPILWSFANALTSF